MSLIETTNPAGSEGISLGAARMREFRNWLLDAWIAFRQRYHDGLPADDPASSSGALQVPTTAPPFAFVGDFFITAFGEFRAYKAGPTSQLMGDLASTTVATFQQASAPIGWVRDLSLAHGSFLRYLASGSPSAGGTVLGSDVLTHSYTTTQENLVEDATVLRSIGNHPAYKFQDVIFATK